MASKKETIDDFLNEVVEEQAAAPKKNTAPVVETRSTEAAHEHNFNRTEAKRKGLVSKYRAERKVAVSISPFYAPYLGSVVRQIVNGIVVDIPCNGQTYYVNETHASHIITKIKRVDAMISRQNKAGDVKNNFEYSPGQLHI
jgi:hypothetical protein